MLGGVVHCVSDNPKSRQSGVFSSKIRVGLINRPFFPSKHEGGWGNSRQLCKSETKRNQQNLASLLMIFNKTIIPFALVGYEMLSITSCYLSPLSITSYPTRARGIIVKYNTAARTRKNAGSEYNILLCQYLRIAAVIVLDGQSTANA